MQIVIIAGSNRQGATSTKVADYAGKRLAQQGHQVRLFDLHAQPLPLYSPDLNAGASEPAAALQQAMLAADAVILATPEYHGSFSGVLKNALDFLGQSHFSGKTVLSISTAGGPVGVSSLQQLQAIIRNLHGINSPEWISVGGSQREAFEQGGDFENHAGIYDRIHRALDTFADLASKLQRPATATSRVIG
ncbi:azobenzene reductase [Paenibacillus cellulosilyticus]|uniref:Azobenzene reductase n=1 Tax=Paenibacillus cellulosilyticus TaxID=375489 RepID=A0A2V2YEB4_9BACL|nr:NADPH-dependent FMN reductase [Paenibacillus cellulosilyticus]PWV90637.1 azobenzene reductase [Paenibacillus cellulosilyticus]QKS43941.1 NAD(P)H-dependent oxidoreductase [Paenibacillus cellulosilyticus]